MRWLSTSSACATFSAHNSSLSEFAVLGFELGFALENDDLSKATKAALDAFAAKLKREKLALKEEMERLRRSN